SPSPGRGDQSGEAVQCSVFGSRFNRDGHIKEQLVTARLDEDHALSDGSQCCLQVVQCTFHDRAWCHLLRIGFEVALNLFQSSFSLREESKEACFPECDPNTSECVSEMNRFRDDIKRSST